MQLDDQGLVNTDPRNIVDYDGFPNLFPTDIRGISFSRTPQQVRADTQRISASWCSETPAWRCIS